MRSVALSELEALAVETGESATLEILSGFEMVIIEEILGEYVTRGNQEIGSRWPVYATSTGKAILAHLPPDELSPLLTQPIRPLTEKTITSPKRLRACLEEIRHEGYAVAAEELELGFIAVGAPLLDASGRPVAAISLGGTHTRMTDERIPEIGALVRAAADRISHRLGYRRSGIGAGMKDDKRLRRSCFIPPPSSFILSNPGGTMPLPTPFHTRTSAVCDSYEWRNWSGYLSAGIYEMSHDREYYAIRNSAALIDVSPLYKYEVTGPDAARLVDRVITRDVTKQRVGQVYYTPWCDAHGKVIDDGTVSRLDTNHFRVTSADPNGRWFQDVGYGLNATVDQRQRRPGRAGRSGAIEPGYPARGRRRRRFRQAQVFPPGSGHRRRLSGHRHAHRLHRRSGL